MFPGTAPFGYLPLPLAGGQPTGLGGGVLFKHSIVNIINCMSNIPDYCMNKIGGSILTEPNGEETYEPQALTENQNGEARADENQVRLHADRSQQRQTRRTGGEDGSQSFRSVGIDDPSPDSQHGKIAVRQVLGKILSRVDELEAKHLAYVESHEKRLEQRLFESKVSKEEALQLIAEIREMTALLDRQLDEEGEP